MKTVAIIQARMSSTRFPGKVLHTLCGMPMIAFMLARVSRASHINELVVATSNDPSDDPLAACLQAHGYPCHRGSLGDVLSRFHGAAAATKADVVVRLTGDCPLIDSDLIDMVVERLVANPQLTYASNVDPPTFPDGLDVEAFTVQALQHAHAQAVLASDREHVTSFIRRAAAESRTATNIAALVDMSALRWTVDYEDDLRFVSALLSAAQVNGPTLGDRFDFYRALEAQPRLLDINQHSRNEGFQKSLLTDKAATQ